MPSIKYIKYIHRYVCVTRAWIFRFKCDYILKDISDWVLTYIAMLLYRHGMKGLVIGPSVFIQSHNVWHTDEWHKLSVDGTVASDAVSGFWQWATLERDDWNASQQRGWHPSLEGAEKLKALKVVNWSRRRSVINPAHGDKAVGWTDCMPTCRRSERI